MTFFEQFNFLLKIFYVIGLKPNIIRETNQGKVMDLITVLVTSSISTAITIYLIFFPHFSSYGVIFVLIYYGSLFPSLLMILTANGHCYFNKSTYQLITNQVGKLEKMFKGKSSQILFAFHYKLKIAFLYTLYILSQILVSVEVWFVDSQNSCSSFLISFFRAMYPLQLLHFVLFCDIATMFFHQLNDKVQHTPMFDHKSGKIELLKYVKLVHMELWRMVVQVNKFFGWNLLFTSIFWFIDTTHQLYWIFLNTHTKLNYLGLLGR